MKADLTIANSNSDGWDAVPLGADSLIRGKLIKFNSEGRFVYGDADVSNDQLVVTGVVTCWVRWASLPKPDARTPARPIPREQNCQIKIRVSGHWGRTGGRAIHG